MFQSLTVRILSFAPSTLKLKFIKLLNHISMNLLIFRRTVAYMIFIWTHVMILNPLINTFLAEQLLATAAFKRFVYYK